MASCAFVVRLEGGSGLCPQPQADPKSSERTILQDALGNMISGPGIGREGERP